MLRHKTSEVSTESFSVQRYFSLLAGENLNYCPVSMFRWLLFLQKFICDQYCHSLPYLCAACYWLLLSKMFSESLQDLWVLLLHCKGPLPVLWSGNFPRRNFEANMYLICFSFFKDHSSVISLIKYLQILILHFLSMFLNVFIRKISLLVVMMMIITIYYGCKYSFCKMKMWRSYMFLIDQES